MNGRLSGTWLSVRIATRRARSAMNSPSSKWRVARETADSRVMVSGSKRWRSLEIRGEEIHRPAPRELGRRGVVLQDRQLLRVRGLVGEGVLRLVAVELEFHSGPAQLFLQLVDLGDRERHVLGGPVGEQRRL